GSRARLVGFTERDGAYRRKLLTLGLTPGVEIDVVRVAPLGDPLEIRVRGSALTLRREEANVLNVEKL
ncbi:MAG: ferrous iron transport protein A, partial [Rhodocyclaceae bacterium]|nr:ferrous iron transport protein A [Rhodocyclaceae bacterium]